MATSVPAFIVRGDDGEDYGPVDLSELRQWVRENRAGLGTTVRTDEPGSLWQPWQYYPELVALLAESNATNPIAGSVLAPMARRIVAFVADLILIYLLLCPIFFVIYIVYLPDFSTQLAVAFSQGQYTPPQLPPFYEGLFELLVYGGVVLYMAGFHAAHGKTPAKAILRLQVVDQNGEKPSLAKSVMRGLILSFSLCLFFFPLLYVFFNPQRRALHDLVAGTYVVEI
jgi:uncharacterized RDD family membrane protein YckC